jgi:flavin reductase (DIM6/NTAB) family NADH-FMN oxidoreductase RutF
MSLLAARSMNVFFMCPRPVVLVSVRHQEAGNLFPMNLFGPVGVGSFAFALNSTRKAAPLVERAGRVALSSVPFNQAEVARRLGKNHLKESVDWAQLPFSTTPSPALGLPVPSFALRVRELEIVAARRLGSHSLFFARQLGDERWKQDLQFCMIQGIYQAWRLRAGVGQQRRSIERVEE